VDEGDDVHWLIVTEMPSSFPEHIRERRKQEISRVAASYKFADTYQLGFPTTRLDQVGMDKLVQKIAEVFQHVKPNVIYVPYPGDAHSDHDYVFRATASCSKWFRHDYIQKVAVYEKLSETDFGIHPFDGGFRPNLFVNITKYLKKKIEIMGIYSSEMGEFPFPRSEKTIRSLASLRGSASGFEAAEAFMVIREIVS